MRIVNLIENTPGVDGCVALHGLSFYVETEKHRVLFDAGPSEAILDNAARLGIDLGKVDIAVLSHGHYDHSGGFSAFAQLNPSAAIYVQRRAGGAHYGYDGPESGYRYIGIDKALLKLPQVRLLDGDMRIDDELLLFVTKDRLYPQPSANARIVKKVVDAYVPDDFSHEQSLIVCSGGKTALLSGCAHAGILNILAGCIRKFGLGNLPQTVISGFHLHKKDGYGVQDIAEHEEIARRLCEYPCTFCTCHCTGAEPYGRMKAIMGSQLRYIRTGEEVILEKVMGMERVESAFLRNI